MKKIIRISIVALCIALGAGAAYYIRHVATSDTAIASSPQAADVITIDEYNEERDERAIKNLFHDDYYWLYPDTSYDVESHMGFTLKYRAPNENPLYVGTLQVKVLHVNGKFAGFTAYHLETVTRYRLLFLAIHKDFRKRGFGEKLARYAVEEMKKMGAQTIVLVTRVNNPAQNIYRRIGFEETSHDNEFLYMAMQVK
jgi:ribosomal protein S18 acetylase RimI-like enzyme